jgi:hypothetical protein
VNVNPVNAIQIKDGNQSLEQREWRWNFITNYQFDKDSVLKGFSVGGAARWQDKVAIGYSQIVTPDKILPDLSLPYWGPSELNGDVWAAYRRPLTDKIDWKLQLNFRNAFGDHDDIPVVANPDGSIAVIRIPQERSWFLSSTFSF